MKKIFTLLSFGFLLTFIGCNKQLVEDPVGSTTDFTFKVEAASPSNGSLETRSSYASNLQNKITDFSIFVFDAEGNFVSQNFYAGSDNMKGRDLFINDEIGTSFDDSFVVYIIANMGDLRNNSALCINGVPSFSKIHDYSYSFSSNFSEFNNKGFPMAGYYESYCPSTDPRTLYANKIVTQYNIRFTKSSTNTNTYTITGGKLVNVPNKCTPFKTFKASVGETSANGDYFTSSDITALNNGSYMPLFVLENEQGIAFPSNITDEKDKKLENINPAFSSFCSYVEFYVSVKTATATYDNVIYRYFFGDNVRDCSIHRNMIYDLTMNFDNVFVEDEGWRIEPGVPDVDIDAITVSRAKLSIIKGMSNTFTVTRKTGVEYDLIYDSSLASTYGVSLQKSTSGNVDTYTVSTSYTPSTSLSYMPKINYQDVPITFTTKDGLVSKTFIVRVNKNPLLIDVDFPNGYGELKVYNCVDWPSNTNIIWQYVGTLYGENVYCNNRAFGRYTLDIWSESFSCTLGTASLSSGDASSPSLQTISMNSSDIHTKMLSLNNSHTSSHTYAVGKTRTQYTCVARADMEIGLGITINGTSCPIPFAFERVINGSDRTGIDYTSNYSVSHTEPQTSLTYKSYYVQAWGDYAACNNMSNDLADEVYNSDSDYCWKTSGNTYNVSFYPARYTTGRETSAPGWLSGKYYKMNIGSAQDVNMTYNPTIGFRYKRL